MEKEKILREIFEIYKNVIFESGEKNSALIDFDTIQLDSLGIVKFVTKIEDKYHINLDKLLTAFNNAMNVSELIEIAYNQINEET